MSAPIFRSFREPEPANAKPNAQPTRLPFSHQIESVCYWFTMLTLAIATVYLVLVTANSAPRPDRAELGWGAITPQWIADCLPLFVTGVCLGEAGYSFCKGMRSWKEILVGAGFLLLPSIGQWLPSLAITPHH